MTNRLAPSLLLFSLLVTSPVLAAADNEVFHGWSKDGTWLVYETHGRNDLVELYFCATGTEVNPTWPAVLNDADREDLNGLSCVRFLDPNKAPYQWKSFLVLPAPAWKALGLEVQHELVPDGENPGFVVLAGDKKQNCYASGTREDSKLTKAYFHPNGRYVGTIIDGNFRHCTLTVRGTPAAATKPPPKKR